jgi:hypothetical protein
MEEKILKLLLEKPQLSARELANILEIKRRTVLYYIKKNGIVRNRELLQKTNNTNRNTEIEISDTLNQIFMGLLLGDGSVYKYRKGKTSQELLNSYIYAGHSITQKDYALYIKSLMEKENIKTYYHEDLKKRVSIIKGREVVSNGTCRVLTMRNHLLNKYRDEWYLNNIKIVPPCIKNLNSLGLSIWFMDDGSKNNFSYFLHTEGFCLEDINKLRDMLKENFNIETTVNVNRGKHFIYIRGNSKNLFKSIIEPYMCNSMKYKLFN